MIHSLTRWLTLVLALSTIFNAAADNWIAWRGRVMTGVGSEQNLPLTWSAKETVRWRAELPGLDQGAN